MRMVNVDGDAVGADDANYDNDDDDDDDADGGGSD